MNGLRKIKPNFNPSAPVDSAQKLLQAFRMLDNSQTQDLSAEQLRFLEEDLKRNQERRPKFIFFHQSFWILFLKAGNRAFPLHTLAKQYGVDYVISGHGHQLIRMVEGGVTYLEVGSSGANIGDINTLRKPTTCGVSSPLTRP